MRVSGFRLSLLCGVSGSGRGVLLLVALFFPWSWFFLLRFSAKNESAHIRKTQPSMYV